MKACGCEGYACDEAVGLNLNSQAASSGHKAREMMRVIEVAMGKLNSNKAQEKFA